LSEYNWYFDVVSKSVVNRLLVSSQSVILTVVFTGECPFLVTSRCSGLS